MPYLVKLSVLVFAKGYDDGLLPTRHLFKQVIEGENVYFGSCILMSTVDSDHTAQIRATSKICFFHPNLHDT